MLTVQVAAGPVPVSVLQATVFTVTAPVGVLLVPVAVSVTVTVHVNGVATVPDAGQTMPVVVVRPLIVTEKGALGGGPT
jgi:hypothetical protein